ncbi:MAG: Biopolymer transport protein ExbD/TolR [Myxococcaceae bacterium]|nr:Biopolymer transport protein ExbD/TolR [Myxococcaceae bacterium]
MTGNSADAASADDATISGINITPLVDISLVLLIVFMVTAKVLVTQAIPMQVPQASNHAATQVTLAIEIAPDGSLRLDGTPVADGAALTRAVQLRAGDGAADLHAVIAASRVATHGAVIGAIDALHSAGVKKIAFAVAPKAKD